MKQNSLFSKILLNPIVKIVLGLLGIGLTVVVLTSATQLVLKAMNISGNKYNDVLSIVYTISCVIGYYITYRLIEHRHISELCGKMLLRNIGLGLGLGFGLMSLVIAIMDIFGGYSVTSINLKANLLPVFILSFCSGISEEILLRGVLFRIVEEKLGSYISLVISALVFGFLHFANPGSSTWAALAIAIEAGVLLAAAYVLTRNLWCPIALHFAWNFAQGGIFGAPVSGINNTPSIICAQFSDSELLTGGSFGPEASIQAPIICLIASIIILLYCLRDNKMIRPFWIKH